MVSIDRGTDSVLSNVKMVIHKLLIELLESLLRI